jgi:uncharacterized protein YebE (UPF0316 family)
MLWEGALIAAVIFGLRVLNYAVGTVRLVAIARDRRMLSAVLAFLEALIFAVVIANVVNDLENVVNMLAYCLGASVGSYVGMMLDARMITSYVNINVISTQKGSDIAARLRESGHGVTESIGRGQAGEVTMLTSVIDKKDVNSVLNVVHTVDPKAFITMGEASSIEQGWLRARKFNPHRNQ